MNARPLALFGALVFLVTGCQGSFSSGPQVPQTLTTPGPGQLGGAQPNATATPGTLNAKAETANTTYDFKDAATGYSCPQLSAGITCLLRFNVPLPTPAPSPSSKASAAASPSGSPSASPPATPSPQASASVSSGTFSFAATAFPSDAPGMVVVSKDNKVPPTTAILRIVIIPSADFPLSGPAVAQFTLPKDQVQNRGFALQLFEEVQRRHHHTTMRPLYSLTKSSLDKQTLTFGMTPPKMTLPKGHHYVLVLYGDAIPATPAPSPSAAPASSASPGPQLTLPPGLSPSPAPTRSPPI